VTHGELRNCGIVTGKSVPVLADLTGNSQSTSSPGLGEPGTEAWHGHRKRPNCRAPRTVVAVSDATWATGVQYEKLTTFALTLRSAPWVSSILCCYRDPV
jgi:hypothetical protein